MLVRLRRLKASARTSIFRRSPRGMRGERRISTWKKVGEVKRVVHGIGGLQVGEAAVLRLERRLQVGRVVDGMGPGVAGEQLKAFGETLGEIKGQRVVPGVAVGKLRVHAVEGNGNAEAAGVACALRERDLSRITCGNASRETWKGYRARGNSANQPREGRIRPRRPEEVEERRRADESNTWRGTIR